MIKSNMEDYFKKVVTKNNKKASAANLPTQPSITKKNSTGN